MKFGMTLWKILPLYPNPFSPVHKARKFSAVLGTTSLRSYKVITIFNFSQVSLNILIIRQVLVDYDLISPGNNVIRPHFTYHLAYHEQQCQILQKSNNDFVLLGRYIKYQIYLCFTDNIVIPTHYNSITSSIIYKRKNVYHCSLNYIIYNQ